MDELLKILMDEQNKALRKLANTITGGNENGRK